MAPLNQGFEYRRVIGAEAAGQSVIEYLAERFPAFTRKEWMERIQSGRVRLEGKPVQPDLLLKPGRLLTWIRPPWKEPEVPCSYAILYRDDHLLAVAKPSGLPTLPGGGGSACRCG